MYKDTIKTDFVKVLTQWGTAGTRLTQYAADATSILLKSSVKDGLRYPYISGVKSLGQPYEGSGNVARSKVTVNGTEYTVANEYNADGTVKNPSSEYAVLEITVNGTDPKAIYNFGFTVAPAHYYSADDNHRNGREIDIEKCKFGVEWSDSTFQSKTIQSQQHVEVPVGAGAYAASKASGGITGITAGEFYNNGVIYFESNPHFVLGEAKIKKVRYQVVSSSQMLNALYNGEIDYATPNAKVETVNELNGKKSEGINNKSVRTMGYGYIGINAGKVPDLAVRQAIMHCINTQACVDYYRTTASIVHRPMSRESWAYPKDATAYYPYIEGPVPENLNVVNPAYAEFVTEKGYKAGSTLSKEDQEEFIRELIEDCGYKLDGNDVYTKTKGGNHTLKYTFTVAGEDKDHPAWDAMWRAYEILNQWGFDINVTTDAQALRKLSSGDLTVWAAAWGSTIDPDMYQVYHKDSKATSVNNWGYTEIKLGKDDKYSVEWDLIEYLSDKIELAREIDDSDPEGLGRARRAAIYSEALDIVMQLAVELPTYQRDDLFAYNYYKLDESTLNTNVTAFKGLTSDLHLVSLVIEK
jgi:peptide/nickel transport system substrate-binding protein